MVIIKLSVGHGITDQIIKHSLDLFVDWAGDPLDVRPDNNGWQAW